jgi:hypothetical protein
VRRLLTVAPTDSARPSSRSEWTFHFDNQIALVMIVEDEDAICLAARTRR